MECACCSCVWALGRGVSGELGDGGEGAGVGAEGAESGSETVSAHGVVWQTRVLSNDKAMNDQRDIGLDVSRRQLHRIYHVLCL